MRQTVLISIAALVMLLFQQTSNGGCYGFGFEPGDSSQNSGIEPSSDGTSITVVTSRLTNSVSPGSTGDSFTPTKGSIQVDPSPSDEPEFGSIPVELPEASTGSPIPYLYHGESPSIDELQDLGGSIKTDDQINYYILYNNKWCADQAAFWLDDRTNSVLYINNSQYLTHFEKYPDGHVVTTNWGFMERGFHPAWFSADEKGWHRLAIWGSEEGWSNVIWIYVW